MAEAPTGKEHTVTFSGTITGNELIEWRNPAVAQPFWMSNNLRIGITAMGAVIYARQRPHDTGSVQYYDVECWTGPQLGQGAGTQGSVSQSFPTSGTTLWTLPLAGNYTITAPTVEMYRIDGDGQFPNYGGTAYDDPPKGGTIPVYDVLKVGGTLTVSANIAGVSVTASTVIATASTVGYADAISGTAEGWGQAAAFQVTADWTRTGLVNLSAPFSFSALGCNMSAGTGLYLSAPVASGGTAYRAIGNVSLNADRGYNYQGVNRLPSGSAYPGTVQFLIDRSGSALAGTVNSDAFGTVTDTNTQRRYSAGATFQDAPFIADVAGGSAGRSWNPGTSSAVSIDEWAGVRAWVNPAWASGNHEDIRDFRALHRVFAPWAAGTIIQAGTVGVYTSDGSDSAAGTLTVANFNLETGTDQSLLGTAIYGVSLSGYRYLPIVAQRTGGTAATLVIGNKQWNRDYLGNTLGFGTAAASTAIVDLLCPTNGTVTADNWDTRFPLTAPAPYRFTESSLSGVATAGTIQFIVSGTINLTSISVIRRSHSKITCLPAFMNWIDAGDGSQYRVDFLFGDTDYRKSLEGIDCYRNGTVVTERSIYDLGASINGGIGITAPWPRDGWTLYGTASGSADVNRNNVTAIAANLCGAGATYSGSAWTFWQGVSASGSVALQAQLLADCISEWPPNCGDVFGFAGSGTTGNIEIRGAHYMRGGAWGAVHNQTNYAALAGTIVTVTDLTDSVPGGTAATDANGGYYSGTPFVRGNHSARIQTGSQTIVETVPSRKLMRGGFMVAGSASTSGVCYDVSKAQRHAIAYQNEGGTIVLGLNTDAFGLTYGSVSTGIAGTATCLKWEDGAENRLYLMYGNGGSAFVQYTKTEGASWTMAGTITTAGTGVRSVYAQDGRKYYFWREAGSVFCRPYDSTDVALGTAFPIVACDNTDIDVDEWSANSGQWRINLHYRSSGNLLTVSSVDGVNYS